MTRTKNNLTKEDVKEFMNKLTSSELKDIIKHNDENKTASKPTLWWSGPGDWKWWRGKTLEEKKLIETLPNNSIHPYPLCH